MPDKYTLRRTILGAVRDCEPAAARFSEICECPAVAMNPAITTDMLLRECIGLVGAGYLADLCPGRTPLYRIADKGRQQIARETDLDEYIWGEFASRFSQG